MAKVVIFGTGKAAALAYRYLHADSDHVIVAFAVDKEFLTKRLFYGLPVVDFSKVETLYPPDYYMFFSPLGFDKMNELRSKKYFEIKEKGYQLISYVHSSVPQIEPLLIGENCLILENNSINLDVSIGNNVVIWSGNQIGDSSVIQDHCWISSKVCISGYVNVGAFSILGVGSTVRDHIVLAEKSFIGASAFISTNTEKNKAYLASPTNSSTLTSEQLMAVISTMLI